MGPTNLSAVSRLDGDQGVIEVSGQLDLASVLVLRAAIDKALGDGATSLLFDLTHLDFMDSAGLGQLAVAHNDVAFLGGRVAVTGANALTLRLLEISGLGEQIDVVGPAT